MSITPLNPAAAGGRNLNVVNALMRGHGHLQEAALARLREEDAEAPRASNPAMRLAAADALEAVCRGAASAEVALGAGLPARSCSARSVEAAAAALADVCQYCAASDVLLAHAEQVAASPALLKQALPIHFLAGRLREVARAALRLRALGQADQRDLLRHRQARSCRACLRIHGVDERDLPALGRLRDRAVEESGVAPAALRRGNHLVNVDRDFEVFVRVYLPLAEDTELRAIQDRHRKLRVDSGLSAALLCTVTFSFVNGESADAEAEE